MTEQQLRELAGVLWQTRPDEITCDEWVDRVGGYAEAVAAGRPVPEGSGLVEHHLEICPECKEEFDVLVEMLRASPADGR